MLALLVLHLCKVSCLCRCIVQRLGSADISVLALGVAPSGVRAVAPRSAPAWMPGVYAKGLCKDAKPTKHIQPFTGERGLGIRQGCRDRTPKGFMQGCIQVVEQSRCRTHRQQTTTIAETQSPLSVLIGIENSHYLIKNRLFLQANGIIHFENMFTYQLINS